MLTGIWTGARNNASWHTLPETPCDFYDIKGVVEELLKHTGMSDAGFTAHSDGGCPYMKPGRTAVVSSKTDGAVYGLVGELRDGILENFDIAQAVYAFELNLDVLIQHAETTKKFTPLPKYPAVARDITMIVDQSVESNDIIEKARKSDVDLLEDVFLFDKYEGEAIESGKKSISFRITYRSPSETLEDEKINDIHRRLTERLLEEFDAAVPV